MSDIVKLVSFKAKKVHNRFNFDFDLNETITLITGKNGSGKTTALKFMDALLKPKLEWISSTKFKDASIQLIHKGLTISISAKRDDTSTIFEFAREGENKIVYVKPNNETNHSMDLVNLYRGKRKRKNAPMNAEAQLTQAISNLPTPMYLSLKRRAGERKLNEEHDMFGDFWDGNDNRNTASELEIALEVIEEAISKMETNHAELTTELREDLLVGNFTSYATTNPHDFIFNGDIVAKIKKYENSILPAFRAIGVPEEKIQANVLSFFNRSIIDARTIKKAKLEDLDKFGELEDEVKGAIVRLFGDVEKFSSLRNFQDLINNFNNKKEKIFSDKNKFLRVLNSFYSDSGIKADIDRNGSLNLYTIQKKRKSIVEPSHLSSGERQILVLISHLVFNSEAKNADIIIIDEPELSLHIAWQEIFCDMILDANKSMQAILATHSPSIIMDRTKQCISL